MTKNIELETTIPLYEIYKEDINRLYPEESEKTKVVEILRQADEQTSNKTVHTTREVDERAKFIARWHIRLKYGVHWKKPSYVWRTARNYAMAAFKNLFYKDQYVFRGIEFALTFRCNFSCNHCLCARIDESDTRDELSPLEYSRIVREAMDMGAVTFGMEGGEPFVHKDWEKIVNSWQPKKNHIQASSNGFLFNDDLARRCADIGIDTINFSLDSGIRELHDLFRRKRGSYDKVMNAVELCDKYGIKVIYNTVVHRANLYTEGLHKLFVMAEGQKNMVNVLFAKGVGAFKDKSCMLDTDDFNAFHDMYEPFNYWHIHHEGKLKSNHGGMGCPGVKEMFNMTPYGDVINCANNHVYLGNVREESLQDIRERAIKQSPFGKYRPCFLTQDEDFMNVYYPLLETKGSVSLEEFNKELKKYEDQKGKKVYPEL